MSSILSVLCCLSFVLLGLYFMYRTIIVEYIPRENSVLVDCKCVEVKTISSVNSDERLSYGVWEYYYNNKKCFWESRIRSNFGLPRIGEISKIAINSDNGKVIYVKSRVSTKIKMFLFSSCFVVTGIIALIYVV